MSKLKINSIEPNPKQARKHFDESSLQELSDSIKTHGLVEPIVVRPLVSRDTYQIVSGERRWRACKLAGLDTIDAIVKEVSEEKAFLLSLIENVQRDNLNPIDEALAYQNMIDKGYTQKAVSEAINKGRSYIAQKLRLLSLPDEVKELVSRDTLSEGQARQLLRLKGIFKVYSKKPELWIEKAKQFALYAKYTDATVTGVKRLVDRARYNFMLFALGVTLGDTHKPIKYWTEFDYNMADWQLKRIVEIEDKYELPELCWWLNSEWTQNDKEE